MAKRALVGIVCLFLLVLGCLAVPTAANAAPSNDRDKQLEAIKEPVQDLVKKTSSAVGGALSAPVNAVTGSVAKAANIPKLSPSEIMKNAVTDALTDGFGQLAATAFDGVIGFITKPLSWLLAMLGKMWIEFTPILPDSAMGSKVTNKTLSSFSALAGLLMLFSS